MASRPSRSALRTSWPTPRTAPVTLLVSRSGEYRAAAWRSARLSHNAMTKPKVTPIDNQRRRLNTALDQANAELGRVDGLLDKAESIGGTVDSASRLAYLAFSNPVIKGLALATGAAKAAKALRHNGE